MTKIAIAVVHGVEIADAYFAETAKRRLLRIFGEASGLSAREAENPLVYETVHWAPVFEDREVAILDASTVTARSAVGSTSVR